MDNVRHNSLVYRLFRTLLPSTISMLASIIAAILIVGGYLLMQSVSLGTSLPDLFDGNWGVAYTNNIVQPLATVFNNDIAGKAVIAFLWGLCGLMLYVIGELIVRTYRGLHEAKSYVQVTGTTVIQHPGLRSFFVVLIWRVVVVAIFSVLIAALILPIVQSLGAAAPPIVLGELATVDVAKKLATLVFGFAFSLHIIVVFIRLFLMRMRVFGGAEY